VRAGGREGRRCGQVGGREAVWAGGEEGRRCGQVAGAMLVTLVTWRGIVGTLNPNPQTLSPKRSTLTPKP